tara:strand:+ start:8231 stop:11128 length:2898 start_codon:yes stop_codon:yes gene_type:complete
MKFNITMFVPGMPFNSDSLEKDVLGGSETAGLSMAKELARLGHTVRLFCNTPNPHNDDLGVIYYPVNMFQTYASTIPHDICIVQRVPEVFGTNVASKLNVLWVHDLAIKQSEKVVKAALWNIDRILTVSQFHTGQYKKTFDLPDSLFYTSRNGIHLEKVPTVEQARDYNNLVYAARPERGLDLLLEKIFPKLLEKKSDIKLSICGYDNTVSKMEAFYNHIDSLMKRFPNNVKWMGALTKEKLYQLYSTSGAYIYPTPSPTAKDFREVFCISILEAQACGLPVITSNIGALPEVLDPYAGYLTDGDSLTEEYQDKFVENVLTTIDSRYRSAWQDMSKTGKLHARKFSWSGLAENWCDEFKSVIKSHNDDSIRLAHHFLRRSDVILADKIADDKKDINLQSQIYGNWDFLKKGEYVEQYEKVGKTHDIRVFDATSNEPRFDMLVERIKESKCKTILDYGCSHGSYAIHLSNRFPDIKITGIDFDKNGIEMAEMLRQEKAKYKKNLTFLTGGVDGLQILPLYGQYDGMFVGEVLEHVENPVSLINKLERAVKPGGTIWITCLYGPWEEQSHWDYPHRCHIWELGFDELKEMFCKKKKITIDTNFQGYSTIQQVPMGFNFVQYERDSSRLAQPIDIKRKMMLQRPRQTVSVSMICGPGAEQTLRWTLESVKTVADEIVIANCNMSSEAEQIAHDYGAKIIEGADPKTIGFDQARNLTLEHCKMDWILWIDSDEKLLDPMRVHKYLKENVYNGYSIKQHHFAVDADFKPDVPTRLFRNRKYEDQDIKFFGMVHEHPETGINKGVGNVIVLTDVHIAHVGYLVESGRKARFYRNYPLMLESDKKYPDRILNKFFLMRDKMILSNYELQRNGGVMTEAVKEQCQEVIDIYREYFSGKGTYMGADAIEYYSEACRMLKIGAEVVVVVNSVPANDPNFRPETKIYRFADLDDLNKELDLKAEQAMEKGLMLTGV